MTEISPMSRLRLQNLAEVPSSPALMSEPIALTLPATLRPIPGGAIRGCAFCALRCANSRPSVMSVAGIMPTPQPRLNQDGRYAVRVCKDKIQVRAVVRAVLTPKLRLRLPCRKNHRASLAGIVRAPVVNLGDKADSPQLAHEV